MFLVKGVLKICSKFIGKHPCRSLILIAKQVYWNHTSAWVFSCKFAAFFHNNFFSEHLWMAASENFIYLFFCLFIFSVKWTLFFSLQKGENCWYSVFFQLMPWFCTHQFCLSIQSSEAVVRMCSVEKVFLEISENSQENTCARVSLLSLC